MYQNWVLGYHAKRPIFRGGDIMIKFSLPGYIEHETMLKQFLLLQKNHPEYFIENRVIDSIYGMPGNMIWNGGRIRFNLSTTGLDLYPLIDSYREIGIKLRHTCTNMLLHDYHFMDWHCNQYIKYCEQENDAIIVYLPEMADYIRNHYPKYDIIWSTTRSDNNIDTINYLSVEDMLVLDCTYNHNENILSQLKNPQNIEILCGNDCIFDCPSRTMHYAQTSACQLLLPNANQLFQYKSCNKPLPNTFYTDIQTRPQAIKNEDIDYLYTTYNINNFKLAGRNWYPHVVAEMIIYYLIKPEYKDHIRQEILHSIYEQPQHYLGG